MVQQEDGGLWTHGMTVGKGDHNHHDWSYNIQITVTIRRITHNRQHIRPMSITADDYICYQATKHAKKQTDPLDAILEHIKTICSHIQTGLSRTIAIMIQTYMTNNKQKTIDKETGRNTCEKQ